MGAAADDGDQETVEDENLAEHVEQALTPLTASAAAAVVVVVGRDELVDEPTDEAASPRQ